MTSTIATTQADTIRLEAGWTGPAGSGQGGIGSGLLGRRFDGPVQVRLHRPLPLATPLPVSTATGGEIVAGDSGGNLILTAAPAPPINVEPPAVTIEDAARARMDFDAHIAPYCIVCGHRHRHSMGVFPGRVDGLPGVVAVRWKPPAWTVDHDGRVRPEFIWGALDCPASLAAGTDTGAFPALGTITADLRRPVVVGEEVVIIGWRRAAEGRKLFGASALLDPDGDILAVASVVCIAVPSDWGTSSGGDQRRPPMTD